ncbi:glutathionylspermidine synthase family protein (plasmid) [Pseudomonas silesiensis]|uniref:glutathionylspermidine synthase family protein n=1 Tax=Pseudomonas silesiensis TaxID=1853130 RepID=UPI0030D3E225
MIKQSYPVRFDLNQLITGKLPTLNELIHVSVLRSQYAFQLENQHALPFYSIPQHAVDQVQAQATDAYQMMIEALGRLFDEPGEIAQYFDSPLIRDHGRYFIPYARHTFVSRGMIGQSLSGRFDMAVDPDTDSVTGIYEFNGEMTGLLFESTSLQNDLMIQVTGSTVQQLNDWSQLTQDTLASYSFRPDRRIAVVADLAYPEDLTNAELVSQLFGAHMQTHLVDLSQSPYFELMNPEKPWWLSVDGEDGTREFPLDAIFLDLTWDDIVEASPAAFQQWKSWADNVAFIEPAWRWFMSNKGMMAYLTHLLETEQDYRQRWGHVAIIPTYLTPDRFLDQSQPFVSKPARGYRSNNIEINDEFGSLVHNTGGDLLDMERVYQAYCPPGSVEQDTVFTLGVWMASGSRNLKTDHPAYASALCVREFNADLDRDSERFMPHIIR